MRVSTDFTLGTLGRALALVATLSIVAACGEPPRRAPFATPSDVESRPSTESSSAPLSGQQIRIVGLVELHGALALPPAEAALFVSVKPRSGEFASIPTLTRRIDLAGLAGGAAGVLRVPFELTGADAMAGAPPLTASMLPSTIDVEALYDPTGALRDKERVVRRRVPVDRASVAGVTIVLRAD